MSKSIIEQIYYSNRGGVCEKIITSSAYERIDRECGELCDKFEKNLNEEQKKAFREISDLYMYMESEAAFLYFKEGIKECFKLFAECLT